MDISSVGNNYRNIPDSYKQNESEQIPKSENTNAKQDSIKISEEAKSLSTRESKNLEEIKEKVNSGFYNSDAVINQVANAILNELTQQ